ncbi:MAG: zf-HC2 domain-containing protein [Bacteroidales bacterium]|nr:zf-HC2 domain-containing protein [Bacteroidales bacterium]
MSNILLQKYLDHETTLQENIQIENHLASCTHCATKLKERQQLTRLLKKTMSSMDEKMVEIPNFDPNKKYDKIKKNNKLKIFIYTVSLAAACCLITWIFLPALSSSENVPTEDYYLIYNVEGEFDANRPLLEQEYQFHVMNQVEKDK